MSWTLGLKLVFLLLIGLLLAMFAVQNLNQMVELELNLGFTRLLTQKPIPAPWLLFGTFGTGLLLGLLAMAGRVLSANHRISDLEMQLGSRSSRSSDWD